MTHCIAVCPLIHLVTWLPEPWSYSSFIPSTTSISSLSAIPMALSIQGFPTPSPIWAAEAQSATYLCPAGKILLASSAHDWGHLSLFLQHRSSFSHCSSLPALALPVVLSSLVTEFCLTVSHSSQSTQSWLNWCRSVLSTCASCFEHCCGWKGVIHSTALHGVYLLEVHWRSVGKHGTTCGTWLPKRHCSLYLSPALHLFSTVSAFIVGPAQPCQLGRFTGVHWKRWTLHTNYLASWLKKEIAYNNNSFLLWEYKRNATTFLTVD